MKQIVAPAYDCAIVPQRQTVTSARRDGDDSAETGWDRTLAIGVISPGDDCAIGVEGQAVKISRSDSNQVV
jgi:hypothetical protein